MGTIENDSGKTAISGITMRLVSENGGKLLSLLSPKNPLTAIIRMVRNVLWRWMVKVTLPLLTSRMVSTRWFDSGGWIINRPLSSLLRLSGISNLLISVCMLPATLWISVLLL